MNRRHPQPISAPSSVPRVRGDEPGYGDDTPIDIACSPRARG